MRRFKPSRQSYGTDSYGGLRMRYSAQQMLTSYKPGQDVGGLGADFDVDALIGEVSTWAPSSPDTALEQTNKAPAKKSSGGGGNIGAFDPLTGAMNLISSGFNVAGTIIGAVHEGKQAKLQREQELKLGRQALKMQPGQIQLAALEAQEAAAASAAGKAWAMWIGSGIIILGLGGMVFYAVGQKKEEKERAE